MDRPEWTTVTKKMLPELKQDITPKSHRRIPYWIAIIIGALVSCLVANILTLGFQLGKFTFWKTLPKPSVAVRQIVDADQNKIWIESDEGRIFSYSMNCFSNDNCLKWMIENDPMEVSPSFGSSSTKGSDCTTLDPRQKNPRGKVVECLLVDSSGPEYGSITFFALLADGSIKYRMLSNSTIGMYFFIFLSTFVLPVIVMMIISLVYIFKKYAKRGLIITIGCASAVGVLFAILNYSLISTGSIIIYCFQGLIGVCLGATIGYVLLLLFKENILGK